MDVTHKKIVEDNCNAAAAAILTNDRGAASGAGKTVEGAQAAPSKPSYAVIQFDNDAGGAVSIINSQWLTPRRCEVYWPPVKGTKAFDRLLTNLQTSPDEKWKLYGVQRIFYESDSLNEAKRKLKLSEVTSDLETAGEETSAVKRSVKRTQRYIVSGTDSEDDDRHVRPPPVKKSSLNRLKDSTGALVDEAYKNHHPKPSLAPDRFQSSVLSQLSMIKLQNEQILELIKLNQDTAAGTLNPEFKFPMQTDQDMIASETLLKVDENYLNLVLYLKTLGGREMGYKVSRILKHCISDQLAAEYNFYGKSSVKSQPNQPKKAFCALRLRDCIVESVVSVTPGSSAKEVEDRIKVWLKHAPERLRRIRNPNDA